MNKKNLQLGAFAVALIMLLLKITGIPGINIFVCLAFMVCACLFPFPDSNVGKKILAGKKLFHYKNDPSITGTEPVSAIIRLLEMAFALSVSVLMMGVLFKLLH